MRTAAEPAHDLLVGKRLRLRLEVGRAKAAQAQPIGFDQRRRAASGKFH
jgi:hypothetical protein